MNNKIKRTTNLINKAKRIYDSSYGRLDKIYIAGSMSIHSILENPNSLVEGTKDIDIMTEEYNEDYDHHVAYAAGFGSAFTTYESGYYIDVVQESSLNLPMNWKQRTIKENIKTTNGEIEVNYLNPNDLLYSKLFAGREKDLRFIEKMFQYKLISPKKLNFIWNNEINHLFESREHKAYLAAKLRVLSRKYFGKNNNTELVQGIGIKEEIMISLKEKEDILTKKEKHIKNNTKFKI